MCFIFLIITYPFDPNGAFYLCWALMGWLTGLDIVFEQVFSKHVHGRLSHTVSWDDYGLNVVGMQPCTRQVKGNRTIRKYQLTTFCVI